MKCFKCIYYNLRISSSNYNPSYCLKFNTFSELARLDSKKCGKEFTHFKENTPKPAYTKYSTNF